MSSSGDDDDTPRVPRREVLRIGLVTAIGTVVPGCADPSGVADAGRSDAGASSDAGEPIDGSTSPDARIDEPDAFVPVDPPEGVTESAAFELGIASGDVTPDSGVMWTFHATAASLRLVVWRMEGGTYARVAHQSDVAPVEGFVHVDVSGLEAASSYRYAFFEMAGDVRSARSTIGRFVTAPLSDALVPLTIGAISCINNRQSIETMAHAGAREDLAMFCFLGDSTYADGARSVADYRGKWRENLSRPEFRAVRAAQSLSATWDDHEFDNDFDPERLDAAQRAAAVQTFFEHQPVRRIAGSPERVYRTLRWGRTLELFVLDCRNERRPSTRTTAEAEYISVAQMAWLKGALSASDAVFKLILNSVPIADFPTIFDIQARDRWEGYAAQRTEILRYIDETPIEGVLWVAGDFHLASSQAVATSGPGSTQREILVGPGAANANPLTFKLRAPQFDFATNDDNYTVLALDPARRRIDVRWVDGSGSVIERREIDV